MEPRTDAGLNPPWSNRMVRPLGLPRLPRLAAGLVAFPFAAILAAACGGSDLLDAPDASTADGSSRDASRPDGTLQDGDGTDAMLPDGETPDGEGLDAAVREGGMRDADAAAPDADAGQRDADAGNFDSGTAPLMQSLFTAGPFVVLGGATVTNSGSGTVLIGDVGTTGPAVNGLAGPPFQPSGTTEVNNARAGQAVTDLGTAYIALTGRACLPANNLTGLDLGGMTLAPGVYCFTSSALQSAGTTLTFDAKGDPNAVWIIQVKTALTIFDNAKAVVIGGPAALGCRVFWTAGTAATLDGNAQMVGNILASSATSMLTGAKLSPGRAFGISAGVTLLDNTVSAAGCP